MTERPARYWIWRSTDASREASKISVLAVLETVLCVVAYWALVIMYGVTWHHWVILLATPLVLLRSDQSVELGKRWIGNYILRDPAPIYTIEGAAVVSSSCALTCLTSWALSTNLELFGHPFPDVPLVTLMAALAGYAGAVTVARGAATASCIRITLIVSLLSTLMWRGLLSWPWIALGVALSIFVAILEYRPMSPKSIEKDSTNEGYRPGTEIFAFTAAAPLSFIFASISLGILIRGTAIRFFSALLNILPGLLKLPENWRFSVLSSDLFHPPELVPGDRTFSYGVIYSFRRTREGRSLPPLDYIRVLSAIPVFYLPTILWRWSIKSTAWFYLPLMFAKWGWRQLEEDELVVWANSYSSKAINLAWLIFGGVSFAAVTVTLFSMQKWLSLQDSLDQIGAPATVFGFLSALDWSELPSQPWLWFYVPSYALTICIFFGLDAVAKEIRFGGASLDTRRVTMRRWLWIANLRAALTNIGLAVALWYFLNAVDAWAQIRFLFLDVATNVAL